MEENAVALELIDLVIGSDINGAQVRRIKSIIEKYPHFINRVFSRLGCTPLQSIIRYSTLSTKSSTLEKRKELIEFILGFPECNINVFDRHQQRTALHDALSCSYSRLPKDMYIEFKKTILKMILGHPGVNVNAKGEWGLTPLEYAVGPDDITSGISASCEPLIVMLLEHPRVEITKKALETIHKIINEKQLSEILTNKAWDRRRAVVMSRAMKSKPLGGAGAVALGGAGSGAGASPAPAINEFAKTSALGPPSNAKKNNAKNTRRQSMRKRSRNTRRN